MEQELEIKIVLLEQKGIEMVTHIYNFIALQNLYGKRCMQVVKDEPISYISSTRAKEENVLGATFHAL